MADSGREAMTDDDDDYGFNPEESYCHYCGGEGWGVEGDTWDCLDPLWIAPGTIRECPCCGGSGKAEDCTFW